MDELKKIVLDKNVLFITTKNIDYIRNTQEAEFLQLYAKNVFYVHSEKKKYTGRLPEIYGKLMRFDMKDIDVVFAGFSPQLIFPFFSRWKNKTIVIDFFISVFDTLVNDRKTIGRKSIIAKLCHWLDQKTLSKADVVITDTIADKDYFVHEFGQDNLIDSNQFLVWYLEADSKVYFPRIQKKTKVIQGKFVVLYFGSILPLQGVDVVLDMIRSFLDNGEIVFQIIGPIPKDYQKPMAPNIEYINWLPQERLSEYIANADLCLAGHFSGNIDKAKRTIPGKAYIYEAVERKMILGDCTANRELFSDDERHFFCRQGDSKALADEVLKCFNLWKEESRNE